VTTEETNMFRILERNVVREIQNNKNAGEYEQTRR
jgi:curli biogenesis system outer membrane secretion channel CsgG